MDVKINDHRMFKSRIIEVNKLNNILDSAIQATRISGCLYNIYTKHCCAMQDITRMIVFNLLKSEKFCRMHTNWYEIIQKKITIIATKQQTQNWRKKIRHKKNTMSTHQNMLPTNICQPTSQWHECIKHTSKLTSYSTEKKSETTKKIQTIPKKNKDQQFKQVVIHMFVYVDFT